MTTTIFKGDSPLIRSREDLLRYFREGEKPRERWGIGTEHEKLGFYRATHQPLPYDGPGGVLNLLEALQARFGWEPVYEGEHLIALVRRQASITLEPGGQFELSGAVLHSAHDTCRELNEHLREMREISAELGVVWLTIGRNPFVPSEQLPWMPKERYRVMGRYLPTRGAMALDMMASTGTVQTNIDYADEADMARKLRVAMGLTPFLTALYANSPFAHGKPSGYLSSRSLIWDNTDPDRTGFVPGAMREDFGYEAYTEYALDVPMFFIHREGHYKDTAGQSFRRFVEEGLNGWQATYEDWVLHLTTLFPVVRLKQFLELRMADVGPTDMICAFAALTRGLFYDETALGEAELLVRDLRADMLAPLQDAAARDGLRADALGRPVREWCRDVLAIAAGGLERLDVRNERGEKEVKFLAPLNRIVSTGNTLADELLALWEGPWHHRLDNLFSPEHTF